MTQWMIINKDGTKTPTNVCSCPRCGAVKVCDSSEEIDSDSCPICYLKGQMDAQKLNAEGEI